MNETTQERKARAGSEGEGIAASPEASGGERPPLSAQEKAQIVVEFAVAKLDVKPGDVVVVKTTGLGMEDQRYVGEALVGWAEHEKVDLHFLVVPDNFNIGVVHTMTPEEIAKAGAGDWPHERRSGVVAGMTDDSANRRDMNPDDVIYETVETGEPAQLADFLHWLVRNGQLRTTTARVEENVPSGAQYRKVYWIEDPVPEADG